MKLKTKCGFVAALLLAAGPALARDLYDDAYFVKSKGTASGLFQDRGVCRRQALGLGTTSSSYSNPQYGAINAMGSALDEGELHEGGLRKRLQRAVFDDCMKRLGWSPLEPEGEDAKTVARASSKHPEPLDAWLKAHEPAPSPPEPVAAPVGPPAPAATATPTPKASG